MWHIPRAGAVILRGVGTSNVVVGGNNNAVDKGQKRVGDLSLVLRLEIVAVPVMLLVRFN
jgi:hypothetical protein